MVDGTLTYTCGRQMITYIVVSEPCGPAVNTNVIVWQPMHRDILIFIGHEECNDTRRSTQTISHPYFEELLKRDLSQKSVAIYYGYREGYVELRIGIRFKSR